MLLPMSSHPPRPIATSQSTTAERTFCDEREVENLFVYTTIALGAIGAATCLCVLAVLYGYNKDRHSLRDRIIVTMTLGNLVFAVGCFWNFANLHDTSAEGRAIWCPFLYSSIISFSWGNGLWMAGKFTMVAAEIFIVAVSVFVLTTGRAEIPRRAEIAGHILCALSGLVLLIYWTTRGYDVSLAGQQARTYGGALKYSKEYFAMWGRALQVWVGLLGVVVLVWVYQRVLLFRLLKDWREAVTSNEASMDRDLWDTSDPMNQVLREQRRLLLKLQRAAYMEVAKPLEYYVFVFILFSPPAIVTALQWCNEQDQGVSITGSDPATCIQFDVALMRPLNVHVQRAIPSLP